MLVDDRSIWNAKCAKNHFLCKLDRFALSRALDQSAITGTRFEERSKDRSQERSQERSLIANMACYWPKCILHIWWLGATLKPHLLRKKWFVHACSTAAVDIWDWGTNDSCVCVITHMLGGSGGMLPQENFAKLIRCSEIASEATLPQSSTIVIVVVFACMTLNLQ